jgi:hypothetical protein
MPWRETRCESIMAIRDPLHSCPGVNLMLTGSIADGAGWDYRKEPDAAAVLRIRIVLYSTRRNEMCVCVYVCVCMLGQRRNIQG